MSCRPLDLYIDPCSLSYIVLVLLSWCCSYVTDIHVRLLEIIIREKPWKAMKRVTLFSYKIKKQVSSSKILKIIEETMHFLHLINFCMTADIKSITDYTSRYIHWQIKADKLLIKTGLWVLDYKLLYNFAHWNLRPNVIIMFKNIKNLLCSKLTI